MIAFLWLGSISPAVASGAEALYLTWSDCVLSPLATSNLSPACDTEVGEQELFASFSLSLPIDSVVALEIVVDLQITGSNLPPWWEFDEKGCHRDGLTASTVVPTGSACADPWGGLAAQVVTYYPGEPRGGASQARIKIAVAVLPGNFRRLEDSIVYHAARLRFRNERTSLCTGCLQSGCLVLNSILIGRLPGAPGGDVLIQVPGPSGANRASRWGGVSQCDAVPIRSATWGQIKSLYR